MKLGFYRAMIARPCHCTETYLSGQGLGQAYFLSLGQQPINVDLICLNEFCLNTLNVLLVMVTV